MERAQWQDAVCLGIGDGWVGVRERPLAYVWQWKVKYFSQLWGRRESGSYSFDGSAASP